jgi:signal transduction histidine kinase
MSNLNEWVDRNARKPLLRLLSLSLGVMVCYFCFLIYSRYSEQMARVELAKESVSMGVQQSNRPLIEAAMMSLLSDTGFSAVALCAGEKTEISYPPEQSACKTMKGRYNLWPIRKPIVGVNGRDLTVILSPLAAFGPLLFLVLIALATLAAVVWNVAGISGRLRTEVLEPLAKGLETGVPLSIDELEVLRRHNQERTVLMSKQAASEALVLLSAQVAHDIRSPVFALDAALKDMAKLPEKQRVVVRHAINRIQDVANSLLEKNRQRPATAGTTGIGANTESPAEYLLSTLIAPVISEKRLQYESKPEVKIDFELSGESYDLFTSVQPVEFRRMLSNLLNNAVEALGDKGTVTIGLTREDRHIVLTVSDNGKGIPPEILTKLGQRGETHGKQGGSGLGLFHARTTAENWGGSLTITSELGKGTAVTINLPKAETPAYFARQIKLTPGRPVVVLDDDPGIHELWRARFESVHSKEQGIEVFYFTEPGKLRDWVKTEPAKAGKAICLFDYELTGHQETGLSLAEELGLSGQTILITSHSEEQPLIAACAALKVRMIPKSLADLVPVSIVTHPPRAVLLDDSTVTQMTWEIAAEDAGVELLAYTTPDKFMSDLGNFPKDMPIYIDSELGEDIKGEKIAEDLMGKGFTNICLATAHPPERFAHLPWLKVRSKEAPWGNSEGE